VQSFQPPPIRVPAAEKYPVPGFLSAAGVELGPGWRDDTGLVGADLDRDGRGDLLARDAGAGWTAYDLLG